MDTNTTTVFVYHASGKSIPHARIIWFVLIWLLALAALWGIRSIWKKISN